MSTIFDKVKTALRVSTSNAAIQEEISDLIAAAKADLLSVGVISADLEPDITEIADALIRRAIILYAKAHFGYSEDSEKFQAAYEDLKCKLSMTGDYLADAEESEA